MQKVILLFIFILFFINYAEAQFRLSLLSGVNYNVWKHKQPSVFEIQGQVNGFISIIPSFVSGTYSNTNFEFQISRQSVKFNDLVNPKGKLFDQKITGHYLRFLPNIEFIIGKYFGIAFGPEISFLLAENIEKNGKQNFLMEKPFFADFMLGFGGGLKYDIHKFFISGKYSQTISKETTFTVLDDSGNILETFINKSRNIQLGIGYRLL